MKCDRGADAWNKFEEITHQCFLTSLGRHVPLKINMGFAKVWRKEYFFGEDGVFHMKEFRTALMYRFGVRIRLVRRGSRFAQLVASSESGLKLHHSFAACLVARFTQQPFSSQLVLMSTLPITKARNAS